MFLDHIDFLFCVGCVFVEAYHHGLTESLKVADMSVKVCKTSAYTLCVRLLDVFQSCSSVHLEAIECGYEDGEVRFETALAALDIEEFLGSEVGSESGFSDDIFTEGHSCLGRDDRVASVGDVCERAAMDERRGSLCSLDKVGLECGLEQNENGSCNTHILYLERCAVASIAEKDVVDASSHVIQVC